MYCQMLNFTVVTLFNQLTVNNVVTFSFGCCIFVKISRNYKRKVQGRLKKQLADLTLMAGLTREAYGHYQVAMEILRGANDWMWMGGTC